MVNNSTNINKRNNHKHKIKKYDDIWPQALVSIKVSLIYTLMYISVDSKDMLIQTNAYAYDFGNPGSGLGQVHKCGRVK